MPTAISPTTFPVITNPAGKLFTTADARIISYENILAALELVFDGSETVVTGVGVTGSGTSADPYVIPTSGGSGTSTVVVQNLAQLPAVGVQGVVYFVFDKDGSGTNGIYTWNGTTLGFEDMTPGSASGGSAGTAAFVGVTSVMYVGDGGGAVTAGAVAAGTATFNIPESLRGRFSLGIPSEYIGRAGDGTVTVTLNFGASHPFFKNELTMFPLTANIYSRATEGSGGFDVELRGNNPQPRILPYTTAGTCRIQFAGVPDISFMLKIEL